MTHEEIINSLLKNGAETQRSMKIVGVEAEQWFDEDENILITVDTDVDTHYLDLGKGEYVFGTTNTFLVDYHSILSSLRQNEETMWLTESLPWHINWLVPLLSGAKIDIIKQRIEPGGVYTRFGRNDELISDIEYTQNMIVSIELSDFGRKVNEMLLKEFLDI